MPINGLKQCFKYELGRHIDWKLYDFPIDKLPSFQKPDLFKE